MLGSLIPFVRNAGITAIPAYRANVLGDAKMADI
jgi:hypothetical protein